MGFEVNGVREGQLDRNDFNASYTRADVAAANYAKPYHKAF